jgi:hypothetical protein
MILIQLTENDLCKITSRDHQLNGEIVLFKQMDYYLQCPCYIFEHTGSKRVILTCDSHFTALPYKKSIEFLIDLALKTNDKIWFDELVFKLQYESQ